MCDTYIATLVCICICMSVTLAVFELGSIVDFIQTWNELYNMLMTLLSIGSPVWVLDICLHSTVAIIISIVRTATTYYDLDNLYGMWCLLEVYMLLCACHAEADTGFPERGGVGYRGYGFSYLDLL